MPINTTDLRIFKEELDAELIEHLIGNRTESLCLLLWFLMNVYFLDQDKSIDSICDGEQDKGIDGIWVDDKTEEIFILQSKFGQNHGSTLGDNDLKHFVGSLELFKDENLVEELLSSTINDSLKRLLKTLDIKDKISNEYSVVPVFVTNKVFDFNAREYLKTQPNIEAYDLQALCEKYVYIRDENITNNPITLQIPKSGFFTYDSVADAQTIICNLPVIELLKLDGISDCSLFTKNVRFSVGNSTVNRRIRRTIQSTEEHPNFFLYHNGITITCSGFEIDTTGEEERLQLQNYQVINGCQSVLSFYDNRNIISSKMSVIAKIVKVPEIGRLAEEITFYTNNQNSITTQDLKSRDRVQVGLQRRFSEEFNDKVFYKIKKGEEHQCRKEITVSFAAQLITAFHLNLPFETHLKAKLFGDMYEHIFNRNITPSKVY